MRFYKRAGKINFMRTDKNTKLYHMYVTKSRDVLLYVIIDSIIVPCHIIEALKFFKEFECSAP